MKIAIQGHPERCKEVIDTLINLGGINKHDYKGNDSNICYYIDEFKHIEEQFISKINTNSYKCYTLEEFENEFPFKIGDLCIYHSTYIGDIVVKILGLSLENDKIMYEVGHKDTTKKHSYIYKEKHQLTPYKEMKKERNIVLTLDKAKEWYNKGGELKEVALQAFTESELNPFPKSWEEYCKIYKVPTNIFGPFAPIKYIALWKLELLRNCYRQGWKPDWLSSHTNKYCIYHSGNELAIIVLTYTCEFLSFQSGEVAEEFLKNFESLIKEAGDLI